MIPDLPFTEALAWFRARVPMSDTEFNTLTERARRMAFRVAGLTQLSMVSAVYNSLEAAIESGQSMVDWKETIAPRVAGAFGENGYRLETIFRTNVQSAYSAGRYRQATNPVVKKSHPYWMYSATLDGRTTEICKRLDGFIAPADSEVWQGKHPICHYNCRAFIMPLRRSTAEEEGGPSEKTPDVSAPEGFGRIPRDFVTPPVPKTAPAALVKLLPPAPDAPAAPPEAEPVKRRRRPRRPAP